MDQRLIDILNQLRGTSVGEDLAVRTLALASEQNYPAEDETFAALEAFRWFLDRAAGCGIELTAAGYLKPADVEAASSVVPAMGGWIGTNSRERSAAPLLDFRESLQSMGLLRKYKGALVLTRLGARTQLDPRRLRDALSAATPGAHCVQNDRPRLKRSERCQVVVRRPELAHACV